MVEMISQIPATFWGVLAGSFFSLLGIWLTNRASDKRLVSQLNHDRQVKSNEREMVLKKEIYLSAAEAISAGINTIGSFANFAIPDDSITKPYSDKSPAIAKVHIIAGSETVTALSNFMNELASVFLTLLAERAKISKDKYAIDILRKSIDDFSKKRDGTLEMMKQYNLEGIQNPQKWNVLQQNYDFEANSIQTAINQMSDLQKVFFIKQLNFMRLCIEHTQKMNGLIMPLLVAVRRELDLPLDEYAYKLAIEDGIAKQRKAIERFVDEFSHLIQ